MAAVDEDARDTVARVVFAGHVDHGKSTLIGRLLLDLGLLHQSKIDDVTASSARRGTVPEWSYVLDSLQEERDQAITIDTTRLWFAHAGRRYMVIDAPGHRQFLANMLSGASEADAAVLVVDAAAGIGEQTLRHAYLLAFLGISHVVVALNKIDLLPDPQLRYRKLERDLREALQRTPPSAIVPVSASRGDNVASRARSTPWYDGPTIVEALGAIRRVAAPVERAFRVGVQDVYRRDGARIVVGTLAGGTLAAGSAALLLPAREQVLVQRLVRWPEGEVASASAGESIGIVLAGDRFAGRGDTLAAPEAPPQVARVVKLEMFWLDPDGPAPGERLRLKRGTQAVTAVVDGDPTVYDIDAAHEAQDAAAQHNIVRLLVHTATPVVFDRREDDPHGARCVLLREDRVVAIGFTIDAFRRDGVAGSRARDPVPVTFAEREARAGHRAAVVWLTGLSGAGKSTLARAAERRLFERGYSVAIVDGDALRAALNADLGYSHADRAENVRRAAAVASLLAGAGQVVLVPVIAPFAADRAIAREHAQQPFYEVFVNAPLAACEQRDPKGLYRKARAGQIVAFTGIDSPYEPPASPDLEIRTDTCTVDEAVASLVAFVEARTRLTSGAHRER